MLYQYAFFRRGFHVLFLVMKDLDKTATQESQLSSCDNGMRLLCQKVFLPIFVLNIRRLPEDLDYQELHHLHATVFLPFAV